MRTMLSNNCRRGVEYNWFLLDNLKYKLKIKVVKFKYSVRYKNYKWFVWPYEIYIEKKLCDNLENTQLQFLVNYLQV